MTFMALFKSQENRFMIDLETKTSIECFMK